MRVIYKQGPYRIVEVEDEIDLESLKGDSFNIDLATDLDTLKKEVDAFEERVYREGVYGYTLMRWNPEIDCGWGELDSCWGFIGQHTKDNEHYIVDELKQQIRAVV